MKHVRKYVLWTLASLLALFLLISAVVYFAVLRDEDKIKTLVIGELNKSLTAEVSVERMNLTFWSSFPYIALDFRNVTARGSNPDDSELLLEARRLSLNFDLRSMLAKKYEVRKIDLSGAIVRIKLYADGSANYMLWKSEAVPDPNFSFALKRIQFKNTQIYFLSERLEQRYEVYFHRANAHGDFSANLQKVSLSGDLELDLIQFKETVILSGKNMNLRTQLDIDNSAQAIHFLDGFIRLEGLNLDWSGVVNYSDTEPGMDFEITGEKLDLRKVLQEIPANLTQKIEVGRIKGDFDFRLNLSNELSECRLQIPDFSARLGDGDLAGNFTVDNFQSPSIQLNSTFSLSLKALTDLISIPEIMKATGESSGQIQYRHTFESWELVSFSEILKGRLQAEVLCQNIFCKLQDSIVKSPIRLTEADFKINQNHLQIPVMKGEFAESQFQASLFLHNFLGHLRD